MSDNYLFYPVVIIGAGPSGAACGLRLLRAGIDCCIIEKSTFPRVKLCAGVVTAKSRRVLSSLLDSDAYGRLTAASLVSREAHLRLWQRDRSFVDCDFSLADHCPPTFPEGTDCRIHLFDRPRFDAFLADEFRSLGGELMEGDGCERIDFDNKTVVTKSGRKVGYNVLVAADGAVSHVEHLLNRHDESFRRKRINSEAYEINVDRKDADIDGVNIYFGFVPDTYAWAFAKDSVECLGLCKLQGKHFDGKAAMHDFCSTIGLQHESSYPLHAAMIPIGNPLNRPVWHQHVYFIGDAAGLNEPLTGEGIYYALESGVSAAVAIAEGRPESYLKVYKRLCRLIKKGNHYQQLIARKTLYSIFHYLAERHNRFVGYFYQTQIERDSLQSFASIVWSYLKAKRLWGRQG